MATKRKADIGLEPDFTVPAKTIEVSELSSEFEKSYLEYAYSVITARALPDARDGLKPVHRRTLYAMAESGLIPEKAYVKSAKVVGNVIGTYHPHGDVAVYEALVKLAQSFNMMLPLADGKGNFGSPDDGPAAARYTEVRLDQNAVLLTSELKDNVVDTAFNYDSTKTQPVVLPAQYPNLLVNGTTGIAVGMASNMPTHNPSEIMDAARWLLTHPNATLEKLMEFVPGPDFPTGGTIVGVDKIKEAYETGRGIIKVRGAAEVEKGARGRNFVVITSLPYGVGPEKLMDASKKLVMAEKLTGITDIRDLSDKRVGTKVVFSVKAGVNPNAVMSEIFRLTPLEVSFGINNVCLVGGEPQTLGLKRLLEIFLEHRFDVVLRRHTFQRDKKVKASHLLEGLIKAVLDIDKAIAIIRNAEDTTEAREGLKKKFKVDDVQAEHILSLELRRLTRFDQHKLANDKAELDAQIVEHNKIINSESELRRVIGDELTAVKKVIARPRRSVILDGAIAEHIEEAKSAIQSLSLEIEDGDVSVVVYSDGSIKRVAAGEAVKPFTKSGTVYAPMHVTKARLKGGVVLLSNKGKAFKTEVMHLSESPVAGKNVVELAADETIISVAPIENQEISKEITAGHGFLFVTKNGVVKVANPDYPKRDDEFEMISLAAGDEIVSAQWIEKPDGEIFIVSSDSSLLKFGADKVRPQGRSGGGMTGIKLADGAHVIAGGFIPTEHSADAVVVTSTGTMAKVTPFALYPPKGRATGGVRTQKFLKGEDRLAFAGVSANPLALDEGGKKIDLPDVDQRRDGSGAKLEANIKVLGR